MEKNILVKKCLQLHGFSLQAWVEKTVDGVET